MTEEQLYKEKLTFLIDKAGIKAIHFANLIGVHKSTLGNWRTGVYKFNANKYQELKAVLNEYEKAIKQIDQKYLS